MGTALDETIEAFDVRQAAPWTMTQYEQVRRAAVALVRTHVSIDEGSEIVAGFSGPALWRLIGSLSRDGLTQ